MDVARLDALLGQGLGRAGMDRDVGARDGQDGEDVLGRIGQADIAEHRGDRVGRATAGDQHQQGLGVIDAAVGIEDQPVARHGSV